MRKLKKIIFVLLLLFTAAEIHAQSDSSEYKYWITWGLMMNRDISVNLNYTFSIEDNFYKAGYLVRGHFLGGPGEDGYLYNSVDISIGKRIQSEWFQSSIFAGPSYVFGEQRQDYGDRKNYKTFGLQSDLQLLFRLANEVGIGVGLYANLNFKNSFAGFNINITIGNGK